MHQHPANRAIHDQRTFGQRSADKVAAVLGSWRFVLTQTVVIALWICANIYGITHRWDPYPFILLNLCLSLQAAYAAPILQLSGNRQVEHDRLRAEADHATLERLREINERQLDILETVYFDK